MSTLFLVALFIASSLGLAALATRRRRRSLPAARAAGAALLEFVALWVLCLAANLAIGTLGVILIRTVTTTFVSVYIVNDLSIVVVSALQAFMVHAWLRPG